jgi:hypothetical protein
MVPSQYYGNHVLLDPTPLPDPREGHMQQLLLLAACTLVFSSTSAFANNYGALAYDRQSCAVGLYCGFRAL